MADDLHGIADLLADAFDLAPFELQDVLTAVPLLSILPMVPSSNGTTHKWAKMTGLPVVGFRAENVGRDMDSTDTTIITDTLKILDWTFQSDVAVANAWRRGRENYIAREGLWHLRAALKAFEVQCINGATGASDSAGAIGSAAGFAGLRDLTTVDALADTAHVVNAGGTTIDTASSVWGVRVADNGVAGVFKGDGPSFEIGETVIVPKISSGTLTFPTYYTPSCAWLGFQQGSVHDVKRIVNLTADSGKGLTDLLMSSLLALFPVGFGPTHFLMSRRSRMQLQKSRTTYSPTGQPAPLPTEYEGIPIVVTDSISDTEELIA